MKIITLLILLPITLVVIPGYSSAKELPKFAVWDLAPRNTPETHAQELTSILVSEIAKLKKYEVYSQENVRTLAGWTSEKMRLGCTDTKCLTALGQMDIVKLISGSVGKIGTIYSISLNLFDTQKARAENAISEFCRTEDDLIPLVQKTVRRLLGETEDVQKVEEEKRLEAERKRLEEERKKKEEEERARMAALQRKEEEQRKLEEQKKKQDEEKKRKEEEATRITLAKKDLKTFKNTIGMEFVLIPEGTFMMGSPRGEGDMDERPRHKVTISRPFYMQTTEVTQRQWKALLGTNPSKFKGDDLPVEQATWEDAQEFVRKLNAKEGTDKYRLPTEAEWEYACRAGNEGKWTFGNDESSLGEYAWYSGNSGGKTQPVGKKRPNAWGLYDMHGNVYEWCQDLFGVYSSISPKVDPKGPSRGEERILRGGSWDEDWEKTRCAYRNKCRPLIDLTYFLARSTHSPSHIRGEGIGFRLVRTP